ncbi:MAG: V-type ATP synthase subunit F [Clostridium sp.]|nr:V-type ATP synthase subunit F [Clostridium sp.]
MYKVGIIGDKDSVLGFKAIGISVFPVTTPQEAEDALKQMSREQYAVIYITEQIAKDITSAISRYSQERFPAIIPIPGNQGSLGIGMSGLKRNVERAVGADILFRDE